MNHRYYYVPSTVNMNKLEGEIPSNCSLNKDKLGFLISLVLERGNSDREQYWEFGFINLKSTIMQHYIQDYSKGLKFLVSKDILWCNDSYSSGNLGKPAYSKGYGISLNMQSLAPVQRFVYSSKFTYHLRKKIKRDALKTALKPCEYLNNWFDEECLKFDYQKAVKILDGKFKPKIWNNKKSKNKKRRQYQCHSMAISSIRDRCYRLGRDNTSGRYYNPFTNLKKEFRKAFSYKGQKLYQIDIVNCQPYLLQMLLNDKNYKKFTSIPLFSTFLGSSSSSSSNWASTIMLVKSAVSQYQQEFQRYNKSVNNGTFYEDFMKLCKKELRVKLKRDEAKKAVYQVLFSGNQWINPSKIERYDASLKKLFSELFPGVYSIIKSIKTDRKETLAVLLQCIEAYLIIDVICKRITTDRPEVPIYTIHDSISTTEGNIEYVKGVMIEEFKNYVSNAPKLKVEKW